MQVPTSLLPDRITIEPYLGSGAYGPSYGDPVTLRARVEGRRRAVRTSGGVDVIGQATATVRPTPAAMAAAAVESKVTHGDRTYEVLDVVRGEGLTRLSHLELILGGPR